MDSSLQTVSKRRDLSSKNFQSTFAKFLPKNPGRLISFVLVAQALIAVQAALSISGSKIKETFTLEGSVRGSFSPPNLSSNSSSLFQVNHSKQKREAPLGQHSECTVSRDQLLALKKEINAALSGSSRGNSTDTNCEFSGNDNSVLENCAELIKLIQCGVNHLKNAYLSAIKDEASSEELIKWRKAYEDISRKIEAIIDDSRRKLDQDYGRKLDELKTQLQITQRLLNELSDKLAVKTEQLCVANICNANINSAVENYRNLIGHSMLERILRSVYEHANSNYGPKTNGLANVENMISFLKRLPTCGSDLIGYPVIYAIMRDNDHLSSPIMLLLSKTVQEASCMKDQTQLKSDLATHCDKIIDSWADQIRNHNFEAPKQFRDEHYAVFNHYLRQLVEKSYQNNRINSHNILEFSRNLPSIESGLIALSSLLSCMKTDNSIDTDEFMTLASYIKEYMEMPNYPQTEQSMKDIAERMKSDLPSAVRRLIWNGDDCTIKNQYYGNYLYAAGDGYAYDNDRRRVFTWKPGNMIKQGDWSIKRFNANGFTLLNRFYYEYLYASGFNLDDERGGVFTWRPGGEVRQALWRIRPVWSGRRFVIFNSDQSKHLASDDVKNYDDDRRSVMTIKDWDEKVVWEIVC